MPVGGTHRPDGVSQQSWVKAAGFDTIPTDLDGFLRCARS